MLRWYVVLTALFSPLIELWVYDRLRRGKEDPRRIRERFGIASIKRPAGTLVWLHAASVGEANSVLLLIRKIRERFPPVSLLLTTGTVTSAMLMQSRLPEGVIHQYVPVDTPQATLRFMRHWRPDIVFFVESELWPNLVMTADYYQCFTAIINGRMSERSFRKWRKRPVMIARLLRCFNVIFAQSEKDAGRFEALGAKGVMCAGNLKCDASLLPCDEAELMTLQTAIGSRPVWLAASTHPGEEEMVAATHRSLAKHHPKLLTLIVPRHPERGAGIARALEKQCRLALRSKGEPITEATQLYIGDTLGELGLFYRLSEIVFMGGSLVKHGGQNPLEAARLACGIITGPYTHNFSDVYQEMEKAGAVCRVANAAGLFAQVKLLLGNTEALDALQTAARQWVMHQGGTAQRLLDLLAPIFEMKP